MTVTERFKGPAADELSFEFRPEFMAEGRIEREGLCELDPARYSVGRSYLILLERAPSGMCGFWDQASTGAGWRAWVERFRSSLP